MSGHGVELIQSWFRKYLYKLGAVEEFPPVGFKCPLSSYLRSRGAKHPYVGTTHYITDAREYEGIDKLPDDLLKTAPDARKLPTWAAAFIQDFDRQRDFTTLGARQSLSRVGQVQES
jgi:hypothetical protein